MDVLSEVLRVVKLEGALFFNAEFSAPWCLMNSGLKGLATFLTPPPEHLIIYHFLTDGRAYTQLPEGKRVELTAGDIVVYPHGDPHLLGNGFAKPVDSIKTFSPGLDLVRFGGGGEVTKFVCGYLACDPRLSEVFLAGLPPVLKVHLVKEASDQWLENSIKEIKYDRQIILSGIGAELPTYEAKLSTGIKFKEGHGWAHDWVEKWNTITDSIYWEIDCIKPGKYLVSGSWISSLPSSCNLRIVIAVNVLETEATWNGVESVTGVLPSRFTKPLYFSKMILPFLATIIAPLNPDLSSIVS